MATAESEVVHTQALGIVKGPRGAGETQMPIGGVLRGVAGLVPFFSGRGERGGPDMPLSSL